MHTKEAKEKTIILDLMKDHSITCNVEKMNNMMYDALVGLYQSESSSKKMLLRNKL
jgi:hypothetical protein